MAIVDLVEARVTGRIVVGDETRPHSVAFMPEGDRARAGTTRWHRVVAAPGRGGGAARRFRSGKPWVRSTANERVARNGVSREIIAASLKTVRILNDSKASLRRELRPRLRRSVMRTPLPWKSGSIGCSMSFTTVAEHRWR